MVAIDGVKVSPLKVRTYSDMLASLEDMSSSLDETSKRLDRFELRAGLGNKLIATFYENDIGYFKGSVEDKTTAFCMSDTFISNEIENTTPIIEEIIPDRLIVNIKRWIKRHILVFVINYISNEALYEKLVNTLSDDLVFEEE